jgi:hypothetical protein
MLGRTGCSNLEGRKKCRGFVRTIMELWFVKTLGFLDRMNGCKPSDFTEVFVPGKKLAFYICCMHSAEICTHSSYQLIKMILYCTY